jgi:hypothetical protein
MNTAGPAPAQIQIIRIALFAAPLLFGIVVLLMRGTMGMTLHADALGPIRLVAYLLFPAMLTLILALRAMLAGKSAQQRFSLCVSGWAAAESTALMGGVFMLLGGEPWAWVGGLAFIAVSWQLLPAGDNA